MLERKLSYLTSPQPSPKRLNMSHIFYWTQVIVFHWLTPSFRAVMRTYNQNRALALHLIKHVNSLELICSFFWCKIFFKFKFISLLCKWTIVYKTDGWRAKALCKLNVINSALKSGVSQYCWFPVSKKRCG